MIGLGIAVAQSMREKFQVLAEVCVQTKQGSKRARLAPDPDLESRNLRRLPWAHQHLTTWLSGSI